MSRCSDEDHSATESAYFESLKRCPSDFGNVGIAVVEAAVPAAAVPEAAAASAAAAVGCIPQCLAGGR